MVGWVYTTKAYLFILIIIIFFLILRRTVGVGRALRLLLILTGGRVGRRPREKGRRVRDE